MPRCSRRGRLGLARARMGCRGASATIGPGIEQCDGFLERDGLGRLVARQRRIDAGVTDIGAVTAVLGGDRSALGRVVAERAARIGAEAAGARAPRDLLWRSPPPARAGQS